jgi:hypothetical protein
MHVTHNMHDYDQNNTQRDEIKHNCVANYDQIFL